MPDLNIQLLQPVNEDIKNSLTNGLNNITGYSTSINNDFTDLNSYLDKERQQYNAVKIIESINIQNYKGKAKAYQVKQVLLAVEKLEVDHGIKK